MLRSRSHVPSLSVVALVAVALVLGLAGCGGGGGGPAPVSDPGPTPPPVVDPTQLTSDLLSACGGQTTVEQIQAVIALFQSVTSGQAEGAGFTVLSGQIQNVPGLVIPWELDADGQNGPEATGSFAFEDAGGTPSVPFTPQQLMPLFTTGIAGLPVLLAAIPDGTQFIMVIEDMPGTPNVSGSTRATFQSAQPTLSSGNILVSEGDCAAQTTWSNVPMNSLTGMFPNAVFNTRVTQVSDELVGTITTDGTNTAVADVSLNSAANTQWEINLTTGQVTQIVP
ncbi:MAG: hypothetical protein P1V36_05260 [Planctomycetota bacterium]|nr:hypothetical protein [Planctomycetota bacterium]